MMYPRSTALLISVVSLICACRNVIGFVPTTTTTTTLTSTSTSTLLARTVRTCTELGATTDGESNDSDSDVNVNVNSDNKVTPQRKGFGTAAAQSSTKPKSSGQIEREQKSAKYDEIAGKGGQEYRIFVRKFGSDDQSWLPCGSIAVPRGAQIADAVFANEEGLKSSIVRAYPALRGMEDEFEYGSNLKMYIDDPIEVVMKGAKKEGGFTFGNWLSTLLSPFDTSQVNQS